MSLEKLNAPGVFTPGGTSLPQGQINEITRYKSNPVFDAEQE